MGRAKEYRQRLKYQVTSARKKTLESLLAVQFAEELGMSETEARLLAYRTSRWILNQPDVRGPNQILFDAVSGRESFTRRYKILKKIRLTPYNVEDLDLELEFGLSTMQAGRIFRLIEEAYRQDALLSARQLTMLCNITPASLRCRLAGLRREGIWLPVAGLSRTERERGGQLRSAWALARYLDGQSLVEIRQTAALSRETFRHLLSRFSHVARLILGGRFMPRDPEEAAWTTIVQAVPEKKLLPLLDEPGIPASAEDWASFRTELEADFALSPVKLRAVRDIAGEILDTLSAGRPDGDVVYWAVTSSEPAGKPLEACRLVPVTLTLYDPGDVPAPNIDRDINRLSDIKFKKILRYATQAKHGGGYLTYADLGYLLGIHPEAISRLVRSNPQLAVPLRGAECDIGRGVTHRKKIIQLYLEMHTETEIAARTGHSYEAIENYIKEFAAVLVLAERGLTAPLIRRVIGRSVKLINTYLELIREYSGPEYAFRFHHLRKIFQTHEDELKKSLRGVKL
ncbi:MAG: DUF1670 domain-containing protein [Peptococcaceae bacterium]|jgi:hypothetical protein|nr:DUF1670 domain-containing protein [Peptococcaceae bacterium]MDH7526190.1 DUF1670 domain-containing protein [Peptococcaceae bacterium]